MGRIQTFYMNPTGDPILLMEDKTLLEQYEELDTCTVSDALDALGITPGFGGIHALWGHPKIVGYASTVELEPYTPGPSGAHMGAEAVAQSGPEDVIVVANSTDSSSWGGLLSLGASIRKVRGTVADGFCRDIDEARELEFPVYGRGALPRTGRGRAQQKSVGQPVTFNGVAVEPGDVVVADGSGIAFVPRARAEEVLKTAHSIAARERAIADDLRKGISLPEAMRDARLAGTEENKK